MVQRFNCRGSGQSYMDHSKIGHWVTFEDYAKLRRLLKNCAHNLLEYAVYTRDQIDELDIAVQELHDAMEEN